MTISNNENTNRELARFLDGQEDDWGRYSFALCQSGLFLCHEERLICAADQFYLCTQSSGLFSYFELQSRHAASGYEAFKDLGLPQFAEIIARALNLLGLDKVATSRQIDDAIASLSDNKFGHFLDEAKSAEAYIFDEAGSIADAIAQYIRNNHEKLKRL
ncbi:DUF4375 domain-containing protein [uncultured Litoreibacter sp.]|uniref:DMP19 family protein n=1 Tax=uncultured Litoreibacter sp. TaxID=1392394 RepID=UPI00260C4B85|nr:DUF4375 domain-containing protein [uncultured Litoreibacter sp.]